MDNVARFKMKNPDATSGQVLVADDRQDTLRALRILLKNHGFGFEEAASPRDVLDILDTTHVDVVLMDLNYSRDTTSGQEGLDLLSRIRSRHQSLSVVVMTAWSSVDVAVEAMRRGAQDFIEKPWENERLLSILRTQVELVRARREGGRLAAENRLLRGDAAAPTFIANSPAMQPVLQLIERVGPSAETILLTGENGTGKGVVAHRLHAVSERAEQPMVTVNAGSLSPNVFESELFGHVAGAYTDAKSDRMGRFELADGGTLFLDEIANVPLDLQAKLLHVVETGEFEPVGCSRRKCVDVRLISATNADLKKEVAEGRFRQDLYYRLNTIEISLPPLRDRREDIRPLAEYFLHHHSARYRKAACQLSERALESLNEYSWPGNVRELDHTIARAVLMAQEGAIDGEDLGLPEAHDAVRLEEMTLEEVEQIMIEKAMARCQGNVHQAASQLGLSRSALYRRLQKMGLQDDCSNLGQDAL